MICSSTSSSAAGLRVRPNWGVAATGAIHRSWHVHSRTKKRRVAAAVRVAFPMSLIAVTLTLTGCETPQQRAEYQENLLSAAGFVQFPVDTVQREAALHTLPQNRIVPRMHGNSIEYVLADTLVCGCLYIGDQEAWGRYQRERVLLRPHEERSIESINPP